MKSERSTFKSYMGSFKILINRIEITYLTGLATTMIYFLRIGNNLLDI